MKPIKVVLVTVLAGGISIGTAILGQHWMTENPLSVGFGRSRHEPGLQTLPDFRLPDLDGHLVAGNTWAGKTLVLNYWATWSPPSVNELPILIRAQETWRNADVQFVGIAVDHGADVQHFVADFPVNFPLLIADTEVVALAKRLGNRVEGLPFTVIFDSRGRRVFSRIGEITADELERQLAGLSKTGTPRSTPAD
jgi:thiol-disulfide isomerase/thioredoxin